jgi:hypothetical protein
MENEEYNYLNLYGDSIISNLLNNNGVSNLQNNTAIGNLQNNTGIRYRPITIPDTFKSVVLKTCPEIRDIVSVSYDETSVMYNPETFEPIKKFIVYVDIYFHNNFTISKNKVSYESRLNDYFKMTYDDMDFITFRIESFIVPPEKTNQDKFFELFGK